MEQAGEAVEEPEEEEEEVEVKGDDVEGEMVDGDKQISGELTSLRRYPPWRRDLILSTASEEKGLTTLVGNVRFFHAIAPLRLIL